MSRLAILEFSKHNEVVWSYLKLVLHEEPIIDVYASEFVYNQLYDLHEETRINWIIKHNLQTVEEFVAMHRVRLMTSDRLLFTSIAPRDLKIFNDSELAAKSSLLIHDVHYYFSDHENFNEGVNMVRIIKSQLLQERKHIETSLHNLDQVLVASKEVYDYCQMKGLKRVNGFLDVLVSHKIKQKKPKKKLRIVIPGSVSIDRKNYQPIFDALLGLNQMSSLQKIKVTFLGLLENKQAQRDIRKFESELKSHTEIELFPTFVPQKNFDKILNKAHFLILPISEKKTAGSVHELYGHSTISGCIADMVKFGKPALIPAFYPLPDSLEEVVTRYHNKTDLTNSLQDWIFYHSFMEKPLENFKKYKPKKKAAQFFETLQLYEKCL